MQRTSESIATLAAALAKAQIELVNPDKSLVATIRADGPGGPNGHFVMHRFRAGLRSCAKSWGITRLPPCKRLQSIKQPVSSI